MNRLAMAFVLLFSFGLMVQSAAAEDVEVNGSLKALSLSGKLAFYGKVAIVATSGGDYANPAEAMSDSAVTAWCGTPSPNNRCLLKIMPGVYDVGTCATTGTPPFSCVVYMKEYIDIEGSGENTTKITGSMDGGAATPTPVAGTVVGASNAEIRFLTVENTSAGFARAIFNLNASPSILHVSAIASGASTCTGITNNTSNAIMTNVTASGTGGNSNRGVVNSSSSTKMTNVTALASGGSNNYAVFNTDSSAPEMTNVVARATGGAINNRGVYNLNSSSPTLTNVTAIADGGTSSHGVYNANSVDPATVRINHSVLRGISDAIYNGTGVSTMVAHSQVDGGVTNLETLTCVGAYDGTYVGLGTECETLP